MALVGKQTWEFQNGVYVQASGTAVGPRENLGLLGGKFDYAYEDLHCGEDNWELAERALMRNAVSVALKKANKTVDDIDVFLAGDLLNQNVTANFMARELQLPFLCMFGACSTSMETAALGAQLIDSGYAKMALAATSSHNATAERQYRYPTEYGGQKPDSATFTVTGAGSVLLSNKKSKIKVKCATIGTVQDLGLTDPFDMGSAMAPAAAYTIVQHFKDTNTTPDDYDFIVTGDLSAVGAPICEQLVREEGYDMVGKYNDCGLLIYDRENQEVFAGGSGCACSAVVTYGHLFQELNKGTYKRILVAATGALLSPTMIQQKESIPTISHAVVFESC
ncbi:MULTISPECIES: stage V sporulation protein AD [Bacillaceae]|uniref:Stage V sporulation protein AD n=1 Tax=Gottfriedia luciferensis TaxID=178774 RepID=A0ABX2ZV38_9BACI|nr:MULTISPECIES: stage V sporulation protein AD [Bacillaceae]ODG93615.1 stage V sporulation protein AD [Gottfriedia luciferensis]PGZ91048.1 stage V sporulation protein AD [Bacillus sp. AFS029533]